MDNKIIFISVNHTLIPCIRGEIVKKAALIFIVAMLTLAVAGCTTTGTPTAHPTDTTPSAIPTGTIPTGTPTPTPWLGGYSEVQNPGVQQQTMYNQMTCKFQVYYRNSDWTMPQEMKTTKGNAHHGVIYKLQISNPSGAEQTITAGDTIKSTIQYFINGKRDWMPTSDVFYDPATGKEYGTFTLPNGESKEVYMLAYITGDSYYDSYGSAIDTVSLDLNPHYYEQQL
jgi:hypothetical protein